MRKTFVRLGGFQPPRKIGENQETPLHNSPPKISKITTTNINTNITLPESNYSTLSLTTSTSLLNGAVNKRARMESPVGEIQNINTNYNNTAATNSTITISVSDAFLNSSKSPLHKEKAQVFNETDNLSSHNAAQIHLSTIFNNNNNNSAEDYQTPQRRTFENIGVEAIFKATEAREEEEENEDLFESQEALQREVEEDLRLSEDLAFTPNATSSSTIGGGGIKENPKESSQSLEVVKNIELDEETAAGKKIKFNGGIVLFDNNINNNVSSGVVNNNNNNSITSFPITTSSPGLTSSIKHINANSFYDLPNSAKTFFANRRGVKQLYPWQNEVLMRDDIRSGGSLVYSLPTSGGKTLVAEISLLRCLINQQKSCFFVLPFVSLAEEKTEGLRPLGDILGFAVDGHYGTQGRLPLPKRISVYVCTIEKANSLLNHMLEEGRTSEIGTVVVDELHMLGESRRGATLELFLSKILCLPHAVQIIGMSATIPNLPNIAKWLRASCYLGEYRPVPLRQYAVIGGMVLQNGEINERNLVEAGFATETQQLLLLATELKEGSVLIFCASRQQCVYTARLIARYRKEMISGYDLSNNSAVSALLSDLSSLGDEAAELSQLIPYGVAFHHGGLLWEERELIEKAYRLRQINILCCTSTLAAGVNLPAQRVIFKTPYIGCDFLTKSRYLQMCGRAGRAGLDEFGESFLLLARRDGHRGIELMKKEVEPCSSQIFEEAAAFEKSLLECIAVGIIKTPSSARNWISNLLCNYAPGPFDAIYDVTSKPFPLALEDIITSSINQLIHRGLVHQSIKENNNNEDHNLDENSLPIDPEENIILSATPFGICSVRSCFGIEEAILVREELEQLQRIGLILADDLHLCYFVTPLREIHECNWSVYRDVLSQLSENRQRIALMLGVDEFFVHQRAMGLGDPSVTNSNQMFTTRRFFVALMLADILSEIPMPVVEQKYQCNRGQLQSLMRSASMFSSSITSFCHAMEWFSLEAVLASFVKRLGFGVKPDIIPLMEIKGVQPGRARALWAAGFKDIASIAGSTPGELLQKVKGINNNNNCENKAVKYFTLRAAVSLIREANILLQQQIREKKGELSELALRTRVP